MLQFCRHVQHAHPRTRQLTHINHQSRLVLHAATKRAALSFRPNPPPLKPSEDTQTTTFSGRPSSLVANASTLWEPSLVSPPARPHTSLDQENPSHGHTHMPGINSEYLWCLRPGQP
ncbi:hypothetical protein LSH36_169g04060 [Paralvinella palmiformis]|uniref:Uncharacterized protein n=1 Tax=Paralvinella palmiformis TaxID=53620 RepID=A0AAD9N651_9ANNE|nr:hypothetical protein LSH36_169g04060 [Paralvinella palmiformis]